VSLAERRWLRLFTLCVLYVAQGIPWGFTATTIPAYLAERGLSRETISVSLAMTTLPYSLKWVWGPIIDAFTIPRLGRRRPWILLAQLGMALTLGALIAIPDLTTDLRLLAYVILIHTVFNALQDVAVDALAIDLLDEAERGRTNGLMYAAKYGGGFIGGAGLSNVVAWAGFDAAVIVLVAILLAIMLVPLLVPERRSAPASSSGLSSGEIRRAAVPAPALVAVARDLVDVLAVRSAFVTAVLVLAINVAHGVVTANGFKLFMDRLGWAPDEYANLVGLGLLIGAGASVVGGFLADAVGHRRLVALGSLLMAASWALFALAEPLWDQAWLPYTLAIVQTLASAVMTVSLFALCMDVSWERTAASQFTTYMALANFSTTIGYTAAASLPASLDFATVYLAAAGVQVVVTALVLLVDPGQVKRVLPRPEGVSIPLGGVAAFVVLACALVLLTWYVVRPLV
jgi:PAT family beta-lactamase induction signal transducer AmpG